MFISIMIVKAGWEIMSDTLDDILGRRPDRELTVGIKRLICEEPEVRGAYDLVLNNYGPNKFLGSVHVELPELTASRGARAARRLRRRRNMDRR